MSKAVPIDNDKHFFRDINSKGLLNVDGKGLQAYKKEKNRRNEEMAAQDQQQADITLLKEEMNTIKIYLAEILNRLK